MTSITARLRTLSLVAFLFACGGDDAASPPAAPVVTTVEISPNPIVVFMGDTTQLTATVKDQNGAAMSGQRITWASDAPAVASIDSLGKIVARTSGTANISASVEATVASVPLTSTGPGTTGAVTGSATIGTAGGSVQATLPGGGTLVLTVPAGALQNASTITLEPIIPPPGSLASFRISPAGIQLNKDATLVIKLSSGARLRPSSTLVIEQNDVKTPLSGTLDLNQGIMTLSFSSLGVPDESTAGALAAHGGALAASDGQATGTVTNLAQEELLAMTGALLNHLVRTGTLQAAQAVQEAMETLVRAIPVSDPRYSSNEILWITTVCTLTGSAFTELANFGFVSDYRGLERVIVLALLWDDAREKMNAFVNSHGGSICPSSKSVQTRINEKLTAFKPNIETDLNGYSLEPTPREISFFDDRLRPLIDVAGTLAQVDFYAEAEIIMNILRNQFARMKAEGWTQCRRNPGSSQNIQGVLGRGLAIAPLPGLDDNEMQDDIQRCGMLIDWAVLDANNVVGSNGFFGAPAGAPPGQFTVTGSASLIGNGQLRISSGFLQALLCPAPASQNNEHLEIAAGPNASSLTRVAVLSPSTENRYLQSSSLFVNSDTLRKVAGVAPGDTGTVSIVIRRIGGICSGSLGLVIHQTLGTLTLSFRNEIRFTFDSDLQGWTPGNFGTPDGTPPWAYTHWDFQGGKGVVNLDGRDPTRDDVPNGFISRTVDLPAGVTTLSYELSAHNRPDSHVRYRLLINGQVIRDAVVVNSQVPNFDYATRTVDVSAFAGQTVTIQFEQHDNGSNGNFPGSSKHLYIDNIRIR